MILPQHLYNRPTRTVAKELLGAFLCRRNNGNTERYRIVEVEAYCGPRDLASHASRGQTPRNTPMFGPAGYTYTYFTYGVHWMLNIVTERDGYPAAVLIRALQPLSPHPSGKACLPPACRRGRDRQGLEVRVNGPAKLTKHLAIDGSLNEIAVFNKKAGLWIEAGERIPPRRIVRAARVGITSVPPQYRDKLWRYYIKDNAFVSKK